MLPLGRIAAAVDAAADVAWAEAQPHGLTDRRAVPELRQAVAELRALAAAIGRPVVTRHRYGCAADALLWVYGREVPELGRPVQSQPLFALPADMVDAPTPCSDFNLYTTDLADPRLAAFTFAPVAESVRVRVSVSELLRGVVRSPFEAWPTGR